MQRCLLRSTLPKYSSRLIAIQSCRLGTAAHPNPGNFANRSKEEMSEIGRKGGRKGGRARGVGGFHNMDPEKQHEIASRGGRAVNKATSEGYQYARGSRRRDQPSTAPPGLEEWHTV